MRNLPVAGACIAVFVLSGLLFLILVVRTSLFVSVLTYPLWVKAFLIVRHLWRRMWRTDFGHNPRGENGIPQIVTLIGMLFAIAGGVGLTASLTRTEVYSNDGTITKTETKAEFRRHAPTIYFLSSLVPLGLMLGIVRAENHNSETFGGMRMFHYNPGTVWFGIRAFVLSGIFVLATTGYTLLYGFPDLIEGDKVYQSYTFKTDGSHGILVRQPIYLSSSDVTSEVAVIETRMDKEFAKNWILASVDGFDGPVSFQDFDGDVASNKWLKPQPALRDETDDQTIRTVTLRGALPEGRYTFFFRLKYRGKESSELIARNAMEQLVTEKFTFRVQVKSEPIKPNE